MAKYKVLVEKREFYLVDVVCINSTEAKEYAVSGTNASNYLYFQLKPEYKAFIVEQLE